MQLVIEGNKENVFISRTLAIEPGTTLNGKGTIEKTSWEASADGSYTAGSRWELTSYVSREDDLAEAEHEVKMAELSVRKAKAVTQIKETGMTIAELQELVF